MHILLVEKLKEDIQTVREALELIEEKHDLTVFEDGYEAIQYLSRQGRYDDTEQYPDVDCLLLDIHMPILDGFTVLKKIRADVGEELPILMLTRRDTEHELLESYRTGANGFSNKLGMYLSNISNL